MPENYSPFLLGVEHDMDNATNVINFLKSLNVKKVGFETSREAFYDLRPGYRADPRTSLFWQMLANHFKQNGIRIVFLLSDNLQFKLTMAVKEAVKAGQRPFRRVSGQDKIK